MNHFFQEDDDPYYYFDVDEEVSFSFAQYSGRCCFLKEQVLAYLLDPEEIAFPQPYTIDSPSGDGNCMVLPDDGSPSFSIHFEDLLVIPPKTDLTEEQQF